MSIGNAQKVLAVLVAGLLITAFTPLAEGAEGTWQDIVGDVVWSGLFVTLGLMLVFFVIWVARRTNN